MSNSQITRSPRQANWAKQLYMFLAVVLPLLAALAGGADSFAYDVVTCGRLSWHQSLSNASLRIGAAIVTAPFAILAALHLVSFILKRSDLITPSITILLSVFTILVSWPVNDGYCDTHGGSAEDHFAFALVVLFTWVPIALAVTAFRVTFWRIDKDPLERPLSSSPGEQGK